MTTTTESKTALEQARTNVGVAYSYYNEGLRKHIRECDDDELQSLKNSVDAALDSLITAAQAPLREQVKVLRQSVKHEEENNDKLSQEIMRLDNQAERLAAALRDYCADCRDTHDCDDDDCKIRAALAEYEQAASGKPCPGGAKEGK